MTTLLRLLVRLLFRFRAFNEDALRTPGPVLLIPNHTSWFDWLFVGVCLGPDWKFVTSSTTAKKSWLHKFVMVNSRTFPIDNASPYAVKHMAEFLQKGGKLVLFAEGRISRTGTLMKLFDGTGFLIHKTHAKVITAYLRGANRLPFSPNPGWKRCFPTVTTHFSEVLTAPHSEHLSTAQSRTLFTRWLRDAMVGQQFRTEMEFGPATVPAAIAETAADVPGKVVLEDATLTQLTYRKLFIAARLLGAKIANAIGATTSSPAPIGVLLPNVNATPVVLLALWQHGKVPAVLNYSTGSATMLACVQLAGLKHIVTSRTFLARAKLDATPFQKAGVQLLYLEDLRKTLRAWDKLSAWVGSHFNFQPSTFNSAPTDTAVILFTSGSEGVPKGVELTHRNILANIRQMMAVTDLTDQDRLFNCLPLFHSFGLTVGLLVPMVRGMFCFIYPSPLHYRVIPSVLYDRDCTVLLSTNTFLNGYGRKAHTYDFRSMRYLFAAAEKLQEATAQTWSHRFGVRILEGYGATECAPCLSVNTPLEPQHGSVGRFMPGVEWRLEPVEGISGAGEKVGARESEQTPSPTDAPAPTLPLSHSPTCSPAPPTTGRLFVRGPNIMKGYLNPDANAKFQADGGWYDTGDIVSVDAEGFISIRGRLKRFAKISGEMVSLTAVEDALAGAFPHYGLRCATAVVTRPDADKGEALICCTNEPRLTAAEIRDAIKSKGLSNLCVPRELVVVKEIPKLGTGKTNHRELQALVASAK